MLDHALQQSIDLVLTIAVVTAFHEMVRLLHPTATVRTVQLEWPQEIGRLLEVRANGENFVDQVFDANDILFAEILLNNGVVGDRQTLSLDLGISALVNQLTDSLQTRITPSDVRIGDTKHLDSSFVQLDKNTVVDLTQTKKLKDLARGRMNLVDATNSDDERKLGLIRDIVVAGFASLTLELDGGTLLLAILIHILLGALENLDLLCLGGLDGLGFALS